MSLRLGEGLTRPGKNYKNSDGLKAGWVSNVNYDTHPFQSPPSREKTGAAIEKEKFESKRGTG